MLFGPSFPVRLAAEVALVAGLGFLAWQNDGLRTKLANTIAEHNAAVAKLQVDSDARIAEVREAMANAPKPRPAVIEAVRQPARGDNELERLHDIDRRFLEALR